jgi:hypothetical protein
MAISERYVLPPFQIIGRLTYLKVWQIVLKKIMLI